MSLATSGGVIVPEGYEVVVLKGGRRAALYAPERITEPETGEDLGRRRVAEFDRYTPGVELDVGEIAELDSMIRECGDDYYSRIRREDLLAELAGIYRHWVEVARTVPVEAR